LSNASPILRTSPVGRLGISRLNLALAALLVLQLLLAAFMLRPGETAGSDRAPLVGDLSASDVNQLSITDNTGLTIAFTRAADGWVLADTDGYPSNSARVEEIMTKLMSVTTERLVTRTSGSHARLQVADDTFQRRVRLTTGTDSRTILLGSSAGAGATHVRIDGNDEVYLTGAISAWEFDTVPSSWIDTAYFRLDLDSIRTMTVENATGTMTLLPQDDVWTLADLAPGETPLASEIRGLVTRAASINLNRPLGTSRAPDYGLDAPQATITLVAVDHQDQEQTYTLLIGAKEPESNTYIAKASNSDYYVTLAAFTGDEFVTKQRADLLAPPDETSAAPGVSGVAPAGFAPLSPVPTPADDQDEAPGPEADE
jgi:hypothetical protein